MNTNTPELNLASLPQANSSPLLKRPAVDSQSFPEKALQFGEGNFLRAFVDWMIDECNSQALFKGRVVIAQPIPAGLSELMNSQDNLYTLILRGLRNGESFEERQIITSVSRTLNPYANWPAMLNVIRQPELRFIFSNTTEAGITHSQEPFTPDTCPNTFPAKLTALLYERWRFFNGAHEQGMIVIPCELIDRNGDMLRKIVLQYTAEWLLPPDFAAWIQSSCIFANTLVDRIVPGYPKEEAKSLTQQLGYKDSLLDTGELFHLWVIEAPESVAKELPFCEAGLNVVWTDDMTPYRTRKVRILNGAHTASVLAAFLAGIDTVGDMMQDSLFGSFVRYILSKEVIPTLDLPRAELDAYAGAVMDRFRNPFIRHELLSISLNSVSKWKVRVMPSLLTALERTGSLPQGLCFSLSALIAFYRPAISEAGSTSGSRGSTPYPIRDDEPVLDAMKKAWSLYDPSSLNPASTVKAILSNISFWDQDLNNIPGLQESVTNGLSSILTKGARAALKELPNINTAAFPEHSL